MIQTLNALDTRLFYAIHSIRNDFLNTVMPIVSADWWPWVLGLAVMALWSIRIARSSDRRRKACFLLFSIALLLITSGITEATHSFVKYEIRRARPGHVLPNMYHYSKNGWFKNPKNFKPVQRTGDSFFSGHAAHSTALAVTVATLCPALSPWIYAAPAAVGYSRIYLGRHYPGDVLGGWLVGAALGLALRRATRRIREKLEGEKPKA